jgi:hypothetical protein
MAPCRRVVSTAASPLLPDLLATNWLVWVRPILLQKSVGSVRVYRLIVRRDGKAERLFTRRGHDWTDRAR